MSKIIAFGWYGGKYSHLNWLLPLLPESQHFCDVFGGSAAVLLNRKPSAVETYNDIDGELVNFFKVLRNNPDELIRRIGLTPFSRAEFKAAIESSNNGDEIERARRFFVKARQVRIGLAQKASIGRWANCNLTSRAGMSGAISRWLGGVEGLSEVAQRILRVQLECDSAINVIRRYDSKQTLFYCDPPYVHASRLDEKAYAHEMTDEEHKELASVLHDVQGRVAISGYSCPLMDELYGSFRRIDAPCKKCPSVKSFRTEVLWTNY